ncbi:MAG TPA: glutathione S-transferase family protein [Woeseiaceae bacterium]|nr:glutathione S-transferase family protein [Woeseiaceae bacterium]
MKFYDCASAPSPRRVRLFLAEKGLELPVVQVDLRAGEQFSDEFRAVNPDCTVPVLELDDGTRITEAFAICQYLEAVHPDPPLMGRNPVEQALVTMWNARIEQHGLGAFAEMFRNFHKAFHGRAVAGTVECAQIPALVERGRTRGEAFLNRLDRHFANSEYVVGRDFTLADITALVGIDFAAWSKMEIGPERPNLQSWYDRVSARPSAQA